MARPRMQRTTNTASVKRHYHDIQKQRAEGLALFADQLRDPELLDEVKTDDGLFATTLELACSEYGLRFQAIAERLNMSPAAVGRWSKLENLPVSIMRPLVIQTVADLLEEYLQNPVKLSGLQRGRVVFH